MFRGYPTREVEMWLHAAAKRAVCPLCFDDGAELRFDRKGRPYIVCASCSSRSFIGSPRGLTSFLHLAPHIVALLKQRGQTVRELQDAAWESSKEIRDAG